MKPSTWSRLPFPLRGALVQLVFAVRRANAMVVVEEDEYVNCLRCRREECRCE